MNLIRRLLMLAIWSLCLFNLFHPLQAPLQNLLYIATGILLVLHGWMVLMFSKVLQLDIRAKLDIFIFGSIAATALRDKVLQKQSQAK